MDGMSSTFDPLAVNFDEVDDDAAQAAATAAVALGIKDMQHDVNEHEHHLHHHNNHGDNDILNQKPPAMDHLNHHHPHHHHHRHHHHQHHHSDHSQDGGTKRKAHGDLTMMGSDDGHGSHHRHQHNQDNGNDNDGGMGGIKKQAAVGQDDRPMPNKVTCLVEGCDKYRAKSGYCMRHFKDKSAPIRGPPSDYERKFCVIEGCERLQSKGNYCHRHSKDPSAPIRNKSDVPLISDVPVKKTCSVDGCTRLVVKGGCCSRHYNDKSAPVITTPPFSFNADARWDELFPQLEEYARTNGHCRVPTSDRSSDLARFVVHIRSVYRSQKAKTLKRDPDADPNNTLPDLSTSTLLTPERMEALNAIGFEFQIWTVDPMQWESRFHELMEYKREHGNFHVSIRENATLSSWCKTQRQRYKNTMALYQGIYGDVLKQSQKKAEKLYNKAKEKSAVMMARHGVTPSISSVSEAKNILDPEKIVKLTAVGFEWDLQNETYHEIWETRYVELMKYKIVNGHCRVPKTTGENSKLGQWVKQMRKYRAWKDEGKPYPSTFTEERIRRLDDLDFEWRLKEAPSSRVMAEENQVAPPPPAQTNVIAAGPVGGMVDHTIHNHGYMGGNMNVNDPARQFADMDPNQFHQPYLHQQRGWGQGV